MTRNGMYRRNLGYVGKPNEVNQRGVYIQRRTRSIGECVVGKITI
jgi:hypothetical protein